MAEAGWHPWVKKPVKNPVGNTKRLSRTRVSYGQLEAVCVARINPLLCSPSKASVKSTTNKSALWECHFVEFEAETSECSQDARGSLHWAKSGKAMITTQRSPWRTWEPAEICGRLEDLYKVWNDIEAILSQLRGVERIPWTDIWIKQQQQKKPKSSRVNIFNLVPFLQTYLQLYLFYLNLTSQGRGRGVMW